MGRLTVLLQFRQQIMALMLLVFHGLIWFATETSLKFALSFVLYGLFLMWQPLWRKEQDVTNAFILLFCALALSTTFFFPNEALAFFGLLTAGLISGQLLNQSSSRPFDLLALLIITLEMLVGLVPDTFQQIDLDPVFADYMQTIILVPILLYFVAPNTETSQQKRSQADLMHGLLGATLIFIVMLGGIVINQLYLVDYIEGILLTVFIVSTLTLGISWFWNPGVGFTGLGVLWNRYAMTIGGPFETWINTLTVLIEDHYLTPNEYLQAACENLIEYQWLNAIEWNLGSQKISVGDRTGFELEHQFEEQVGVSIYFNSDPGRALEQHTILLLRMAYQFYLAKLNQDKIRAQEHFATIHHTGARLTHDIKNILQSIKTSLEILSLEEDLPGSQKLVRENMRQISQRLESSLDKLRSPKLQSPVKTMRCKDWIDNLKSQLSANPTLHFQEDLEKEIFIPVDLFDSVADNLISNALKKPSTSRVNVQLLASEDVVLLSVCDDGNAIKRDIEDSLFNQPVASGAGMGVGLYQAAILAKTCQFQLEIGQNEDGRVCFNLYQNLVD